MVRLSTSEVETEIEWLRVATRCQIEKCRQAVEQFGKDREQAVRWLVRERVIMPSLLDPDAVGPEVFGYNELEKQLHYAKARRGTDSPMAIDEATIQAWQQMLDGAAALDAHFLERGRTFWASAMADKHPNWKPPQEPPAKADERPSVTVAPLPELRLSGDWEGEATVPAFAGLQSRGGSYTGRDSDKPSTGRVELRVVSNGKDAPPMPEQAAAFAYLLEHGGAILTKLREAAVQAYSDFADAVGPDDLEDLPPVEATTPQTVGDMIGVGIVHILNVPKDGVCYLGLECGCDWDDEHGFGVMFHKDRLIESGQADTAFDGWAALDDAGLTPEDLR